MEIRDAGECWKPTKESGALSEGNLEIHSGQGSETSDQRRFFLKEYNRLNTPLMRGRRKKSPFVFRGETFAPVFRRGKLKRLGCR